MEEKTTALKGYWKAIRYVFRDSFTSSFHFSISSVNEDGSPEVTPIGSLILDAREPKGVYFEIFTQSLRKNVERDPRVCVLAVNSGRRFWLKSLLLGKFLTPPGLKLYGKAGQRREATATEVEAWRKRTRYLAKLKGYDSLWGNLKYVRELEFDSFVWVKMGRMTSPLQET